MVKRNEGIWTVYRHISPSGKVYIGITSQEIHKRWRYGTGYGSCWYFQKAIDKYGWNNIKHEILFTGISEERAKRLEIDLIRHYKNIGISYNLTDGGQGWLGHHHSDEAKEKMRQKKLGRHLSEETKRKMSEARKGRPGTNTGRKLSEETKIKMRERRKNRPVIYHISKEELSRRFIEAQKGITSIPVYQYTKDGNFITTFASQSEAARSVGVRQSSIYNCCRANAEGKCRTIKGYIWRKAV